VDKESRAHHMGKRHKMRTHSGLKLHAKKGKSERAQCNLCSAVVSDQRDAHGESARMRRDDEMHAIDEDELCAVMND